MLLPEPEALMQVRAFYKRSLWLGWDVSGLLGRQQSCLPRARGTGMLWEDWVIIDSLSQEATTLQGQRWKALILDGSSEAADRY